MSHFCAFAPITLIHVQEAKRRSTTRYSMLTCLGTCYRSTKRYEISQKPQVSDSAWNRASETFFVARLWRSSCLQIELIGVGAPSSSRPSRSVVTHLPTCISSLSCYERAVGPGTDGISEKARCKAMSWLGEVLHTTVCVVAMTDWVITAHDNPSGSCSIINVSLASSI